MSGFQQNTLNVRTGDGLDDVLLQELVFLRKDGSLIRAPIGGTTDGLSVPRCLRNIIPATGGDWFSGVLHDSAYRDQLEILDEHGEWVKAHFTKHQCDDLFNEALASQGVGLVEREVLYKGVQLFGQQSFDEDRAKSQIQIP